MFLVSFSACCCFWICPLSCSMGGRHLKRAHVHCVCTVDVRTHANKFRHAERFIISQLLLGLSPPKRCWIIRNDCYSLWSSKPHCTLRLQQESAAREHHLALERDDMAAETWPSISWYPKVSRNSGPSCTWNFWAYAIDFKALHIWTHTHTYVYIYMY